MILEKQNFELMNKLYFSLLAYVDVYLDIHKEVRTLDDFINLAIREKANVRNALYENTDIIDDFYEENPFKFSKKELDILLSWKNHYISSEFIIYKQYKKHCLVYDQNNSKAYAVLGLTQSIESIFPFVPVLAQTVLLPFQNKIVYDGFTFPYKMQFGKSLREDIKENVELSIAQYGLIDHLPSKDPTEREQKIGLLGYYTKNPDNMDYFEDEINEILIDPSMLPIYHYELAKTTSAEFKKVLKGLGVKNTWFAMLSASIISNGATKEKAIENAKNIVPEELHSAIYVFQHKAQKL